MKFTVVNVELRDVMGHGDVIDRIMLELKRQMTERDTLKEICKKAWDFVSRFEAYGIRYRQNDDSARREGLDGLTTAFADLLNDAGGEIDGILLLVDEADKPQPSAHLGELCKLLTERLSYRNCERVSIGMAGLPGIVGKLRASHESSPRLFEVMPLQPLTDGERKNVVRRGLDNAADTNGYRTEISDEALNVIADLSEGYPHFIQQFAYCAFDADGDNNIDILDVNTGAFSEHGALDQLGKQYFNEMYFERVWSEDYKRVLHAMSEHLDEWISRATIIKESGIKESQVTNALNTLTSRLVILHSDQKRGEYKLPTRAFAVWIKALLAKQETIALSAGA
jgi:hypothetical protein